MVRMKSLLNQIAAVWQSRALVIKLLSFASIGVVNTAIDEFSPQPINSSRYP
jgi:hypothetical protein